VCVTGERRVVLSGSILQEDFSGKKYAGDLTASMMWENELTAPKAIQNNGKSHGASTT